MATKRSKRKQGEVKSPKRPRLKKETLRDLEADRAPEDIRGGAGTVTLGREARC